MAIFNLRNLYFILFFLITGCTVVNHTPSIYISPEPTIAVLPFANMTEVPQADARAAAITAGILRSRGFRNLITYPSLISKPTLIPGVASPVPRAKAIAWARLHGASYAITGAVDEWRYKVGLDGEPVVGVTLDLIDLSTNQVIWSAVGSKSGGSRVAVSMIGQKLIRKMLLTLTNDYQHRN